jgi:hypothetical protein
LPKHKKITAVKIEKLKVYLNTLFISLAFPAELSALRSLASSGTKIPDKLQSILDGKNNAGITMASNIPN